MTGPLHIQGFCRLAILSAGKLITLEKIMDPFFGAGTIAIAVSALGKSWVGIELSGEYIQIAKQRLVGTLFLLPLQKKLEFLVSQRVRNFFMWKEKPPIRTKPYTMLKRNESG